MVRCRECCELCGVFVIVGNLFMLAIVAGLVVTAWILAGAIAVLLPFLLVLAILPGILIMYLWYWRNAKHDVSLNRVYKFALVAVIGIIPVAAAELALQFGFEAAREAAQDDEDAIVWLILWFASEALFTSFVAALCEETLKLVSDVTGRGETIQVCALIVRVQKGDIPYVVLVLSLSSAVGVATLENLLYVFNATTTRGLLSGLITATLRTVLSIPMHCSTGVLIGADVARNKFNIKRKTPFMILAAPIGFHGTFNFVTIFSSTVSTEIEGYQWAAAFQALVIVLVGIALVLAIRQIRIVLKYTPLDYNQV